LEDLKKLAEKYTSALESIKEVRGQLTGMVIKYLLLNSSERKKCTELAMSEQLGIPRSVIRKILMDLSEEPVLETEDFGTVKPYMVKSIGYAVDRNYVTFTRDELQSILEIREMSKMPVEGLAVDTGVSEKIEGKPITRYLTLGATKCYSTFVGRFYSYLPIAEIEEKFRKAYEPKTYQELKLLMPEQGAFSKAKGFSAVIPLSSSELTLLTPEMSPEDIKNMVKRKWEQEIDYILDRLERFASCLEADGYQGTVEKLGKPKYQVDHYEAEAIFPPIDWRFRKEYLWATTMALRNGCNVAEKLGVDEKLLERALTLSDILDAAVEKEYKGREKEGPLEDWYAKQAGK